MIKKPVSSQHVSLGRVMRKRRIELGLSQEKLSELTNCHRNYIGKVERGEQNATLDMLIRISQGLRCKLFDLLSAAGI